MGNSVGKTARNADSAPVEMKVAERVNDAAGSAIRAGGSGGSPKTQGVVARFFSKIWSGFTRCFSWMGRKPRPIKKEDMQKAKVAKDAAKAAEEGRLDASEAAQKGKDPAAAGALDVPHGLGMGAEYTSTASSPVHFDEGTLGRARSSRLAGDVTPPDEASMSTPKQPSKQATKKAADASAANVGVTPASNKGKVQFKEEELRAQEAARAAAEEARAQETTRAAAEEARVQETARAAAEEARNQEAARAAAEEARAQEAARAAAEEARAQEAARAAEEAARQKVDVLASTAEVIAKDVLGGPSSEPAPQEIVDDPYLRPRRSKSSFGTSDYAKIARIKEEERARLEAEKMAAQEKENANKEIEAQPSTPALNASTTATPALNASTTATPPTGMNYAARMERKRLAAEEAAKRAQEEQAAGSSNGGPSGYSTPVAPRPQSEAFQTPLDSTPGDRSVISGDEGSPESGGPASGAAGKTAQQSFNLDLITSTTVKKKDQFGRTQLFTFVNDCNLEALQRAVEVGAQLDVQDNNKNTLLHAAANAKAKNRHEVIEYLLSKKIVISVTAAVKKSVPLHEIKNNRAEIALHLAAKKKDKKAYDLLVAAHEKKSRCETDIKDSAGKSPSNYLHGAK